MTSISRRSFLGVSGAAATLIGAGAVGGRAQAAAIPEAPSQTSPLMQPPLFPSTGPTRTPSFVALSARLPVMPELGKMITPAETISSMRSLRLNRAALL